MDAIKEDSNVTPDGEPEQGALNSQTPLRKVVRRALKRHLEKLRESEMLAREGEDPEGVHGMRTALRRIRTTLRMLEDAWAYKRTRVRKLRRRLGGVARMLGDTRDLDVLYDHVKAYDAMHTEYGNDLDAVRVTLDKRRAEAYAALISELDTPRVGQLLARVGRLRARRDERRDIRVRVFAGSAIWRSYEAVLAHDPLPEGSAPALHQVRIVCKRLRYTLELFEEVLGPDAQELIERVTAVQQHLGDLNDHITAQRVLAPIQQELSESAGVAAYAAERMKGRDDLAASFPDVWERLVGVEFRERLAMLIAHL
jgi:CHAD domain-containing protein